MKADLFQSVTTAEFSKSVGIMSAALYNVKESFFIFEF